MFERYTEKARRVIFFARYEASQFGAPYIETEHLLLGLLREDKALTDRFLPPNASLETIRGQIEAHSPRRDKIPTNIDLPFSNEAKRVIAYSAEEAEMLGHTHIGTEHFLLGLMREEGCFSAALLKEHGVKLDKVRSAVRLGLSPTPSGLQLGERHLPSFRLGQPAPIMTAEELKNWYLKLSDSQRVLCLALVSSQLTLLGRGFALELKGGEQVRAFIGLNDILQILGSQIVQIAAQTKQHPDDVFWDGLSEKSSELGLNDYLVEAFQLVSSGGQWQQNP